MVLEHRSALMYSIHTHQVLISNYYSTLPIVVSLASDYWEIFFWSNLVAFTNAKDRIDFHNFLDLFKKLGFQVSNEEQLHH
jgi:hypothetical protein